MKYVWTFECIKECVEGGVSYIFLCYVHFQFILVAAFIVDMGRVMFSRGVYKIKGFSFTMILLIHLMKCCIIK